MNDDWTQSWAVHIFGQPCNSAERVKVESIVDPISQCISGFAKLMELNYSGLTRR